MITLQTTKKHLDNIKKYKKMFEKWTIWDFAFKEGENYCFLVLYEHPIKGITGNLFLNESGEVYSFEEALKYGAPMIEYNTTMVECQQKMLPRMHKNTAPFQEKLDLIVKEKHNIISKDSSMEVVLNEVIDATEKALNMNSEIKEIYFAIADLQTKIMSERGYLDQEILNEIKDKLYDHHVILYSYGIRERIMNGHYRKIIHFLKNNKNQVSRDSYYKLLRNLQAAVASNEGTLEKSMKQFETDINGKQVYIDPNNIKESLLKKDKMKKEREKEIHVVPYIRNPK